MHWSWDELQRLPLAVYRELVAWVVEESRERAGQSDGDVIDYDVWSQRCRSSPSAPTSSSRN